MLPHHSIEKRLQDALHKLVPDAGAVPLDVRPCPDTRFGDYQTAGLIGFAKSRGINPRQLAADLLAQLEVKDLCETAEVAGPGFLNFRLRASCLSEVLAGALRGEHLFFQPASEPWTVVIDFSSPNVAKPMHVGHIRSTILGDCLARTYRLLGHRVVTDNHIGDWGTQFGKLLYGWKNFLNPAALQSDAMGELERLYRLVNDACEKDPAVLEKARQELVELQAGDPANLTIWQEMIALSTVQFEAMYQRLGVRFDHTLGESFYNPRLAEVVNSLVARGIAEESEGAIAVLFQDSPELKATPALIRKSDGGFNYTTTDLATLQYRLEQWHPDEIVYVTDGRQQLHFRQLFHIFRRWRPEAHVNLVHVWFGAILGEDGRPFKTRSGETIRLAELLDEAEERAFRVVSEKNPQLDEQARREISRIVGIGAVKYADLLPNRQSDYVFSWEKMLALQGNTAPYLLYAYTRIRSIFRKLAEETGETFDPAAISAAQLLLKEPQEVALAKHLLNLGLILHAVTEEHRPNFLCNYLYDLAGRFTSFYENCPVLKAPPADRLTRLGLCELTGRVLKQGLEVLGLKTPEQM